MAHALPLYTLHYTPGKMRQKYSPWRKIIWEYSTEVKILNSQKIKILNYNFVHSYFCLKKNLEQNVAFFLTNAINLLVIVYFYGYSLSFTTV